jgi:hypothetical protein
MEALMVFGSLVSMMGVSLVFQHASYKKVIISINHK